MPDVRSQGVHAMHGRAPYAGPNDPSAGARAAAARSGAAAKSRSIVRPYVFDVSASPTQTLPDASTAASTHSSTHLFQHNFAALASPVVTPLASVPTDVDESSSGESLPWITAFLGDVDPELDTDGDTDVDTDVETHVDTDLDLDHVGLAVKPKINGTVDLSVQVELPSPSQTHDASAVQRFSVGEELHIESASTLAEIEAAHTDEPPPLREGDVAHDEWPLDDAADRLRALSVTMDVQEPGHASLANAQDSMLADATLDALPLPMWNDDEFVDVMPVHQESLPIDDDVPSSGVRADAITHEVAGPAADALISNSDATARALEALAWRVRNGELKIPGFSADLGDAAALATALAALLGAQH